jgi:hypothetical protein
MPVRAARCKMIRGAQNTRRVWQPEQDKQLREMAEAGKSVTMMALRLKRTELALRQRLHTLRIHLRDNKKEPARMNRQPIYPAK